MIPKILGPAMHVGERDRAPASQLWPCPILNAMGIWGLTQGMESSLSLSFSAF